MPQWFQKMSFLKFFLGGLLILGTGENHLGDDFKDYSWVMEDFMNFLEDSLFE